MNKKICVIFIFGLVFLSLFSNFVIAEDNLLDNSIFGVSVEGVTLSEGWKTWGTDFKTKILENSIIRVIDSFFQKISWLFSILFGMPYSLSLALLLVIALWVYILLKINDALKITLFSKWISTLISFGLVIILAQIRFFERIVNFVIQLFFGENPWWMKVIFGIIIVVALVLLSAFIKNFSKKMVENKKKRKDEENRLKLETGAKVGEELSKSVADE